MDGRAGGPDGAEVRGPMAADSADDEISLRVYFETLWRYRQIIGAALVLVSLVFVIAAMAFWLRSPTEKIASIRFRLLFDGAAQNRYPNGIPFSPADIVGAPVVAEVFEANELKRFGTYDYFKQILYVQQASLQLFNLASAYQAKLSDTKITPVERAQIEEEFETKRKALIDPEFSLTIRRSEHFSELPAGLSQKVLSDILEVWAKHADLRKGALKYQVPILSSKSITRDSVANDDYLVTVDLLRTRAVRIVRTIDELQRLPGALTLRTSGGISLPEIRASLEDSIRFDIEPLLGIIRSQGVTKNALQLSLYASNAAFQIRLDKEEIEGRAEALRAGLREYLSKSNTTQAGDVGARGNGGSTAPSGNDAPAFVPQLSESFLDRMEQMFVLTTKEEMDYRRMLTNQLIEESRRATTFDRDLAYYEDLAKAVQGVGNRSTGSPELINLIKERTDKAFQLIAKTTDDLSNFYQELSAQNLGSAAGLYVITGPFAQHTEGSVSARALWMLYGLTLLMTLLVVPAGCLMHNAARRKAI